jgi:hypothetical protein
MPGIRDPVSIGGDEEGEFLIAVYIDDRTLSERLVEPYAHRTVEVLPLGNRHPLGVLVITDEDAHEDLVVLLVHDDVTDSVLIASAERHAKLKFADAPFAESQCLPHTLRLAVRTGPQPFLQPRPMGLLVEHDALATVHIANAPLKPPEWRRC